MKDHKYIIGGNVRMRKLILPVMKKVGERAARVPVKVRSWPGVFHQPKIPDRLRSQMKELDNK